MPNVLEQTWEITKQDMMNVMNHMYKQGSETDTQKSGTILCLPKKNDPGGSDDSRPLTLLNADQKLLTRIIAYTLEPWVSNILQTSQYCGRHGNTKFEVVAAIWAT